MRSGWVAVEVEAAGGFQHSVNFDNPKRHVNKIGKQRTASQHFFKSADQLDRLLGPLRRADIAVQSVDMQDIVQPLDRLVAPFPCIDKRLRLRAVLAALIIVNLEVIAFRIERRIDVTQIDAAAFELAPQHIQIVAIIEPVGHWAIANALGRVVYPNLILPILKRWGGGGCAATDGGDCNVEGPSVIRC